MQVIPLSRDRAQALAEQLKSIVVYPNLLVARASTLRCSQVSAASSRDDSE